MKNIVAVIIIGSIILLIVIVLDIRSMQECIKEKRSESKFICDIFINSAVAVVAIVIWLFICNYII